MNFIINYWHIDKGLACVGTLNLQARSDPLSSGVLKPLNATENQWFVHVLAFTCCNELFKGATWTSGIWFRGHWIYTKHVNHIMVWLSKVIYIENILEPAIQCLFYHLSCMSWNVWILIQIKCIHLLPCVEWLWNHCLYNLLKHIFKLQKYPRICHLKFQNLRQFRPQ